MPKVRRGDWTLEQDAIMREMCEEDASDADIARAVGRTKAGVHNRRWRLGILKPSDVGTAEWADADVGRLVKLFHEGRTDADIARALVRSVWSVQKKRRALDLTRANVRAADHHAANGPQHETRDIGDPILGLDPTRKKCPLTLDADAYRLLAETPWRTVEDAMLAVMQARGLRHG